MKRLSIIMFLTLAAVSLAAAKGNKKVSEQDRNLDVRISWDASTYQEVTETYVANMGYIEKNLYYPRAKRLSDGAILLSYSNDHFGWDIYTNRSEDNGRTWGEAFCIDHSRPAKYIDSKGVEKDDEYVLVNPDFTELQDGRLILCYQWRYKGGYNDLPKTNENCGVMISFSEDKGRSWSESVEVYRGRCWEPAVMQLPSGEIQMYITSSQNLINKMSAPMTVVIRSFDGGKTWQGKELCDINDNEPISRVVDERSTYDGMPSGILLDGGKGIAVPLETWHGKHVMDQTPIIVKTTMEENWRTDQKQIVEQGGPDYPMKKEINKDLQGYGPYGTKLNTGEVVVLCNGTYKGVQGIWTLVGDSNADNFRFATSPFTDSEYWGSIDYIGDDKVLASVTYKYPERGTDRGMIRMMQGRINRSKNLIKGAGLEMPAVADFNRESNDWWFLGKKFASQMFVNFAYDTDNLSVAAYVYDDKLTSFTPENSDAAAVLFARGGQVYEVVVNPEGGYVVYREEGYSWCPIATGKADSQVVGTINNDKDNDLGYSVKVDLPWTLIGGKPAKNEDMKMHIRKFYKADSKEKPLSSVEDLEGENSDYPQEWLTISLD